MFHAQPTRKFDSKLSGAMRAGYLNGHRIEQP